MTVLMVNFGNLFELRCLRYTGTEMVKETLTKPTVRKLGRDLVDRSCTPERMYSGRKA